MSFTCPFQIITLSFLLLIWCSNRMGTFFVPSSFLKTVIRFWDHKSNRTQWITEFSIGKMWLQPQQETKVNKYQGHNKQLENWCPRIWNMCQDMDVLFWINTILWVEIAEYIFAFNVSLTLCNFSRLSSQSGMPLRLGGIYQKHTFVCSGCKKNNQTHTSINKIIQINQTFYGLAYYSIDLDAKK